MSTINDVANEAKVSTITVSRVINNPEIVKSKTRERVLQAMDKVKYTPNPAAKALVTKRVGIIDVYIPKHIDLSNPFVMHFISGISEKLSEHMYSFLIKRDRDREHKCDGYIVTGLFKDEISEMLTYAKDRERKIVLFGHTDNPDLSCVDVDNIKGFKEITSFMINSGRRSIRMINVAEDKDYTYDRYQGFISELELNGIIESGAPIYAENSVAGGYNATNKLLENGVVQGIVCATDELAIGAISAIKQKGLRVPEDISVTGFDGLGHHLLSKPSITTMKQPVYEIGELLASMLVKELNGETNHQKLFLKPEIVIGDSVSSIIL